MKTCLICQAQATNEAVTCVACGEGSFAMAVTVTPSDPKPLPAPEAKPQAETRRARR